MATSNKVKPLVDAVSKALPALPEIKRQITEAVSADESTKHKYKKAAGLIQDRFVETGAIVAFIKSDDCRQAIVAGLPKEDQALLALDVDDPSLADKNGAAYLGRKSAGSKISVARNRMTSYAIPSEKTGTTEKAGTAEKCQKKLIECRTALQKGEKEGENWAEALVLIAQLLAMTGVGKKA